jgi:saccharopine dehydrogenase (NAD+, L-lysine-forming)
MIIYIRSETYPNEYRTPITPNDVKYLIDLGHIIQIETSESRCFTDEEYTLAGASIVEDKWYTQDKYTVIIGLKNLDNLDKLNNTIHVYFSHSLANQQGASRVLEAFKKSHSILFDFEYFTNTHGKRIVTFGYYAGLVGAVLGLRQYYNRQEGLPDILNLQPWKTYDDMLLFYKPIHCKIAIVGNGRCSKGVQSILQTFAIPYDILDRSSLIHIDKYDILLNCIALDPSYTEVWIDNHTIINKYTVIVDISCDYSKPNNPLKISKPTSWETPVYNYTNNISIIAIDNVPSLLPRESSIDFSKQFTPLLLEYCNDTWGRALDVFEHVNC